MVDHEEPLGAGPIGGCEADGHQRPTRQGTVMAVAIPALFGYNYLASRIKNISSDMQIFVDEFITRVAEDYGAR